MVAFAFGIWRFSCVRVCICYILLFHKTPNHRVHTYAALFRLYSSDGHHILAAYRYHRILRCVCLHHENLCRCKNRLNESYIFFLNIPKTSNCILYFFFLELLVKEIDETKETNLFKSVFNLLLSFLI